MPENINLDAQHPSYAIFLPWWDEMEDAIIGQSKIIEKTTQYLAVPGGMLFISDPTKRNALYAAYQKRASYPEITAPTIRGLAGVIHNEPTTFILPPALEYLREKATTDNLTLESLARRLTRGVLSYGRIGIAVTIADGQPYFAVYPAKSILNWDNDERLVVLDESGSEMQENLNWTDVTQRLILQISEEGVIGTTYTKGIDASDWAEDEGEPYSAKGGKEIDFLPFVFIDTNDLIPEPDEVPLLPIVRLAAKMFRLDANYQQTLYLSSAPTFVITGMTPDDPNRPMVVGAGPIWFLPDTEQKASILEFTGTSAAAQRTAINDTMEMAIQVGARLFATADEQQESGEARKIKYAAQTATLTGIALTVSAGLEKALKMAATLMGAKEDEVSVKIDTDFIDATIGSDVMGAILQNVQFGLTSQQTGYELLKQGGRASQERDWEEEKDLIDQEAPNTNLGMEGREEEPDEEEEEEPNDNE